MIIEGNITIGYVVTPSQLEVVCRVFNTAELFERILAKLRPSDLLHAQSVCKGFRDVIVKSPTISRAMFRRPISDKERGPAELAGLRLKAPPYRIRHICLSNVTRTAITFFIDQSCPANIIRLAGDTICCPADTSFYECSLRPSSALRSILLAQPPPKYARIRQRCKCIVVDHADIAIKAIGGLMFGDDFDAIDSIKVPCCRGIRGWTVSAYNDCSVERLSLD